MYSLRANSRYLPSIGRLFRIQHSDFGESRHYLHHANNGNLSASGLSGCLCNVANGTKGRGRGFLLPNHNPLSVPIAALSMFSRSTPTTSNASETTMSSAASSFDDIGPIPEPPPVPSSEALRDLQVTIADNMREIGLASYATPVGWIQNLMDVLHSTTGLPWWEVIVLSTVVVRACTFPIMVYSQRRTAMMKLHQDGMQNLMAKADEAKKGGDPYEYQLAMMEVQDYMKEKGLPSYYKMLIPMAANGLVFLSYFMALRGMATASLWSLHSEGVLWFPDLTATDTTLILPGLCALTLVAMIEVGVEFGTGGTTMKPGMRWFLRLMPLSLLVVGRMMPTAVLFYWLTSNTISLMISLAFRVPKVRVFLKFPPLPKPIASKSWADSLSIPQSVRNFVANPRVLWWAIRDWKKNRGKKATAPTATSIRKSDSKRFKAAGEGPMPPTFTFNPKTKYKEVFEKKSFMAKMKGALFGDKKKAQGAVKRKVAA